MKYFIVCLLILSACATASKINRVSLGMTKHEVVDEMGTPDSTKGAENSEILVYRLYDSSNDALNGWGSEYWVLLNNGKVTRYGRPQDVGHPVPSHIILDNNVTNK